jgi:hypothetical protein
MYSLSTLRALHEVLDADDQQYLYETSIRAMNTARRRGENTRLKFWLDNPIASVKVARYVLCFIFAYGLVLRYISWSSRSPIVVIRKPIEATAPKSAEVTQGPFLYDPNAIAKVDEVMPLSWKSMLSHSC